MIRETLEDIDGAINISDDILLFGKTHEEHDQNLKAVFQRLPLEKTCKNHVNYRKDTVNSNLQKITHLQALEDTVKIM